MTVLLFIAQWAIRSCVLILCGAGLVWVLRVRNAFVRATAWTALLAGSLAIPALTLVAPTVPVAVMQPEPALPPHILPIVTGSLPAMVPVADSRLDWAQLALAVYAAIVLLLLLRLLVGLVLSRRLLREARMTDRGFRETNKVTAPLVLGILRPVLLLPGDWREWDRAKLDAVLAHERSHIARHDPAVQMLSALHRAALWISPASWLLHALIVRTAEEVSDAAAMAQTGDRAFYAEVLLDFMRRGIRRANWLGVPMARYGWADRRMQRILSGPTFFPVLTRWSLAAITAMVSVFAYLIATAQLSEAAPGKRTPFASIPAMTAARPLYMQSLGTVTANTVAVTANADGQLASTGCTGGRPVRAGQVLAMIQSLSHAYTVKAPISGLAGFCKVDPGNSVHAGETLLTITQLHPIAVVFSIPQDYVSRVRALLASGAPLKVKLYDRSNVTLLAIGRVSAIDNAIDANTGTVKLMASFENVNGALFPNAFVNVRLLVDPRGAKGA